MLQNHTTPGSSPAFLATPYLSTPVTRIHPDSYNLLLLANEATKEPARASTERFFTPHTTPTFQSVVDTNKVTSPDLSVAGVAAVAPIQTESINSRSSRSKGVSQEPSSLQKKQDPSLQRKSPKTEPPFKITVVTCGTFHTILRPKPLVATSSEDRILSSLQENRKLLAKAGSPQSPSSPKTPLSPSGITKMTPQERMQRYANNPKKRLFAAVNPEELSPTTAMMPPPSLKSAFKKPVPRVKTAPSVQPPSTPFFEGFHIPIAETIQPKPAVSTSTGYYSTFNAVPLDNKILKTNPSNL